MNISSKPFLRQKSRRLYTSMLRSLWRWIPCGYCTRLLRRNKALKCSPEGLITKEERAAFAELINRAPDTEKDEIVIYYRLTVLAEAVVLRYSADTKEKI